jgi:hypothetical protein
MNDGAAHGRQLTQEMSRRRSSPLPLSLTSDDSARRPDGVYRCSAPESLERGSATHGSQEHRLRGLANLVCPSGVKVPLANTRGTCLKRPSWVAWCQ